MYLSKYLLASKKETPSDAIVTSHQLMIRAGLIRKLASGTYTFLPTGHKVLKKIEAIVREEMLKSGALEILMPVMQSADLWRESQRWDAYGSELFRFIDRNERDFVLGPTHEEVVTDLIRNEIKSYRQLPINLFQIQTKFRDEIRPRFGVMRGREFVMKDAYSFHIEKNSLDDEYQNMYDTYQKIFKKIGLNFRAVEADSGSIGGDVSHEFHVLSNSGEDAIVFSDQSDYASNIEKATTLLPKKPKQESQSELQIFDTPKVKTIDDLVKQFSFCIEKTVKTLIVKGSNTSKHEHVALIIRGDHTLNETKASNLPDIAKPLQFASEQEIRKIIGAGPGSLGPVDLPIPCIVDHFAAICSDFCAGANIEGKHYSGINWERDTIFLKAEDLRNVMEGDPSPDGIGKLVIKRGIEIGHIFKLGDKYSSAMNATALNATGKPTPLLMGCYGIGITRLIAACIEQNHDDKGIIWPENIAPFNVGLVGLNIEKSDQVKETFETLYKHCKSFGLEVLADDRKASPGVKLSDMDLLGIPHRFVVSDRSLKSGVIEYKHRTASEHENIPISAILSFIENKFKLPASAKF